MLEGKVAIVTGGTRGIGYEIVKKFLNNKAKVVLFGSLALTGKGHLTDEIMRRTFGVVKNEIIFD